MTKFSNFLAEIKRSFRQYDSANLIDDMDVYDWTIQALNALNILPTIKIESVLRVKNNKAKLPDGFKSIYYAIKCEPHVYTVDDTTEDIEQDFYFYKVRELKKQEWNSCDPCDVQETDSCIVEKTYLHNGKRANFYYNNLQPLKLKLTPYVKRTQCDKNCVNFRMNDSTYEISINNKTLYTNFEEGNIFMIYNGYEEDEDGFIMIPDTAEGNLMKYIKAYVKKRIIEDLLNNSDNTTNEQFLYTLYAEEERQFFTKTVGEIKMSKVMNSLNVYRNKIKKEFSVFNFGNYSYNNSGRNNIEFIVT
jgi:hypothetical protein